VNLEYSQIFEQRGAMYHRAMIDYPQARKAEFSQLFDRIPLRSGESVLDIPSGGGYLAGRLPAGTKVTELELSSGFKPGNRVVETYGAWNVGPFDRAVCLAALHHIADQNRFVGQLVKSVRPGGFVHIADVDAATTLPAYLDGFVGQHNCTGHSGLYLTEESFRNLAGTRLRSSAVRSCSWEFSSLDGLLTFSGNLFGLMDCPRKALMEALGPIGLGHGEKGACLAWRLRYIDLEVL
jgi:SAM-dependent methyltransferase